MSLTELGTKIESKEARVAVIGLGYVGLPVACMFAQAGFRTTGLDVDAERVATINRGGNPIEGIEPGLADLIQSVAGQSLVCTNDYADIADVDVFTVSVQTPVDDSDNKPRYAHLRSALTALGENLKDGALVIIESTLAPGTLERVVRPTLQAAAGDKTFYLGHCPERVTPGRLLLNIRTMNRVVGAESPEVSATMLALYRHIVEGELDPTDLLTAELVKTTENAYRDVQIAFANEMALICEDLGGDVWRVRELVNKLPGRLMLLPGAGVGGHCITKDSWLLITNVTKYQPSLIPTARAVNRAMPGEVVRMTLEALADAGVEAASAVVAVLGYAYMGNSDDTRDTPTQYYLPLIAEHVGEVRVQDPFVHEYQVDMADVLAGADIAVVMVDHQAYAEADWAALASRMKQPLVVDARRIVPDDWHNEHLRTLGRSVDA